MAPDIVRWGMTRASTNIAMDAANHGAREQQPAAARQVPGDDAADHPGHERQAGPERPAFGRLPDPPGTSRRSPPRRRAARSELRDGLGEAGQLLGVQDPAPPRMARSRSRTSASGLAQRHVPVAQHPRVRPVGIQHVQGRSRRADRLPGIAARRGLPGPPTRSSARDALTRPSRITAAAAGVRLGGGAGINTDGSSMYTGSRPYRSQLQPAQAMSPMSTQRGQDEARRSIDLPGQLQLPRRALPWSPRRCA